MSQYSFILSSKTQCIRTLLRATSPAFPSVPSNSHRPPLSIHAFRLISSSVWSKHKKAATDPSKPTIRVTFINRDGSEDEVSVPVGMSMLEAAHANDIELEGACEASLACSTCHVIIEQEDMYQKLSEPCDDEEDMLDLAFGLTKTSRLGCQVISTKEIDGIRLRIPAATRNMAVDGYVAKPH